MKIIRCEICGSYVPHSDDLEDELTRAGKRCPICLSVGSLYIDRIVEKKAGDGS